MADMGPSRAITEDRFVVVVIVWGLSMAVIESQIEVVATWFGTKHGRLWLPTRGRNDSAGTKHNRLWRPIWSRGYVIRVHVESELDGGRYGRGSGWSEDVMPHLPCQLFRSFHFVFRGHVEYREASRLSRYVSFNAHQHVLSSLGHATLRLTQIVTVDLEFWKGLLSQALILFLNPSRWFLLSTIQRSGFNHSQAYKRGNISLFSIFFSFFTYPFGIYSFPKSFFPRNFSALKLCHLSRPSAEQRQHHRILGISGG